MKIDRYKGKAGWEWRVDATIRGQRIREHGFNTRGDVDQFLAELRVKGRRRRFGFSAQLYAQRRESAPGASDQGIGDFTTVFNSQTLTQSFLDSGTNGIFFDDTALTTCSDPNFKGFYCPAGSPSFTATLMGTNNTNIAETFTVDNAQILATNNPTFSVLPTLAGTFSTATSSNTSNTFDWGLPFYYGRRVFTAIQNQRTAVGTGPYVAF